MRFVRKLCAWLLGSVLFVAGFLKLMDPVGAGLVVAEYFKFFGLGFMEPASKALGIFMALFETILGAAVITGVWRRTVAVVSGATLACFTILTAILLIFNPAMDCGCFGEAVHLTHLQSFIKNLVLCLLWVGAYIPFSKLLPTPKVKYVGFGIASVSVLLFALWSILSVPMIDFTPMKPGAELLQEDYYPDAQVLSFSDADGNYADSLAVRGKVMVVSSYDPLKLDKSTCDRLAEFIGDAQALGFQPLVLAATTPDEINGLAADPGLLTNLYFADRKTLMTFNRSNGGVTYVDGATIVRKWASRSLPDKDTLRWLAEADSTEALVDGEQKSRLRVQAFLLYAFAVMLLL